MKRTIADLLEQAEAATMRHDWDARAHHIQEIIAESQSLFEALPEIQRTHSKGLQAITAEAFQVMGYPINEPAIPFLIDAASDVNRPAYSSAFEALKAMPMEAIAPYAIGFLWDRERPSAWRKEALIDVCYLLMDFEDQKLDPIGPTVAYLLSSSEGFDQPVTHVLLAVLETIGVASAHYTIPTLIALVEQSPYEVIRTRAQRLLDCYPVDELAPYRTILPVASSQRVSPETGADA